MCARVVFGGVARIAGWCVWWRVRPRPRPSLSALSCPENRPSGLIEKSPNYRNRTVRAAQSWHGQNKHDKKQHEAAGAREATDKLAAMAGERRREQEARAGGTVPVKHNCMLLMSQSALCGRFAESMVVRGLATGIAAIVK